jgi:antitoxin (DNA-binding transcriptional repressor) of toxin-antitoxin stability system
MTTITAVELRNKLEEIIDLINKTGDEMILTYRGGKQIKLSPVTKPKKTKTQKALEYFNSPEYIEKLKTYNLDIPELDGKNPTQEKINIRNLKLTKYE